MKTSMFRRILALAFLAVFVGSTVNAFDWGKNKRKKQKQEMKCCNKAMEKECAKEMKEECKKEGKACCDKKAH
ncbi:hypothetical protein [Emticicia sp. 17c]|uniref:hypothetical protein n=1 Tax=Emticicia sp. 17c TaxID=3127704 RepID=UPI00301BC6CF